LKALLILIFLGLLAVGLYHLAYRPAFIVIPAGHPLPKHYLHEWSFGNITLVQVRPDNTVVSIGPWP
jgi:hypothetical protein